MKNLVKFMESKNFWRRAAKQPLYSVETLNTETANELFYMLDCNLSPENLCCDGEISRTEVKRRFALFNGAIKDLKKLGYAVPTGCYEVA